MGVRTPAPTRARRISGVHPIVSSTESYGVTCWGCILLPSPLRVAELNRLQKGGRDRGAGVYGGRVAQLGNGRDGCRVERGIPAGFGYAGGLRGGSAVRIHE